jgi:flagellar biosynthesis/type III secretory pathway chaperone
LTKLIACLREELQQYGEMLARLDDQQNRVIQRDADQILETASAVQTQGAVVQEARNERERAQQAFALSLGLPENAAFAQMLPLSPEVCRPLVGALIHENNELLVRVRQRARQNHVLLARSLELMRQLLETLFPAGRSPVYAENGSVFTRGLPAQSIYEAVG